MTLKSLLFLPLALCLLGCPSTTSTTPPAALAPGYSSQFDQTAGRTLAATHALVSQAITDYQSLTATQQGTIKAPLNALILALNTADTIYLQFHQAVATQAQVQTAVDNVTTAQAAYTAASGVK